MEQTPNDTTTTATKPGSGTASGVSEAPVITEYRAEPTADGTALAVTMEGTGENELAEARVVYGDRELSRQPEGKTVSVSDRLEDTAEISPQDGQVVFLLRDVAGNEARQSVQPDGIAPSLTITAAPTTTAGEVTFQLEVTDATGLSDVHIRFDGETLQTHDVRGTQFTDEGQIQVPADQRLRHVPLGARAADWNGNTTQVDGQSYVRKYDKMDSNPLDIGAVYISQAGSGFAQRCRDNYEDTYPAVGIYDEDPIPTEISTKHIDQMSGHGINRLVYDYGGVKYDVRRGRGEELLASQLIDQIEIEHFYTKTGLLWRPDEDWKETVLPEDLSYLRDNVLNRDNVATIDDRPVVSTWNFTYLLYEDEARDKLMNDFGSYEAFVDDMRGHLRVGGTGPFLIVGKGPATVVEDSPIGDFVDLFDGMTTWFPSGPWREGEDDSWDAIIDRVESYFQNNYQYAKDHSMEFTPRVFPGYNDRGSGCGRRGDSYFPRRPERFRQLLQLAEQYTTRNRIDIATWNDWTEGHQIEPGTHRGTEYGTNYLEVVEELQQGGE